MLLFALILCCGLTTAPSGTAGTREEELDSVVEIPGIGTIRGEKGATAKEGHPVYKFLGIPFVAKPEPFQPPTAFAKWSGTRDVTVPARGCPALGLDILNSIAPLDAFFPGATAAAETAQANRQAALAAAAARSARRGAQQEDGVEEDPDDCLTLDIYTHSLDPEAKAPVFFYIHGGAFVMGSSQMANPDFLLEHGDMVLVSVQYRLGPQGFLASEDAEAPGNAALHDLKWALDWVREYVHLFGGDRDHIVAGGVSAGAALSGLLSISPVTRGYLSGAALFSGGPLVPWTVDADPQRSARGVGVFAGCLNPNTLADCLRKRSGTLLNLAWGLWTVYEKYFVNHGMGGVIPIMDNYFLPRPPAVEMLREDFKGMPLLIGVTRHEGTFLMAQVDLMYMKARALTEDQKTLDQTVGDLLLQFADVNDNLFTLGDAVKRLYFSEETIGNYTAMFEGMVDFTGAGFFKGPAQRNAQLNALAGGESYLYSFDYASENSEPSSLLGGDASTVHHGSDQKFLFNANGYADRDYEVIDTYCELVASFVKDLKPKVEGIDWRPHTIMDDYYLSIQPNPQQRQRFSDMFYIMEQDRLDKEEPMDPVDPTEPDPGQPSTNLSEDSTFISTEPIDPVDPTEPDPGQSSTNLSEDSTFISTEPIDPVDPTEPDPGQPTTDSSEDSTFTSTEPTDPVDPTEPDPGQPTTDSSEDSTFISTEPTDPVDPTEFNPGQQSTSFAGQSGSCLPLLLILSSLLLAS